MICVKLGKLHNQISKLIIFQAVLSSWGPEGEVLDQDLPPEHRPRRQRLPQHPQRGLEARDDDVRHSMCIPRVFWSLRTQQSLESNFCQHSPKLNWCKEIRASPLRSGMDWLLPFAFLLPYNGTILAANLPGAVNPTKADAIPCVSHKCHTTIWLMYASHFKNTK